MGRGKSTWLIEHINLHPERRFLIVVPTVNDQRDREGNIIHESEATRYCKQINAEVFEPQAAPTKTESLRRAIVHRRNIVTSHALIQKIDTITMDLLSKSDYDLIIDESLSVICDYQKLNPNPKKSKKSRKDDIKALIKDKWILPDQNGVFVWNDKKDKDYFDGKYSGTWLSVKNLCQMQSLMWLPKTDGSFSDDVIIWRFPVRFFQLFENSYIATYLWNGSYQKMYFDMFGVSYTHTMLSDVGKLIPYDAQKELSARERLYNLMDIYDGKLNDIGQSTKADRSPFSKNWYEKNAKISRRGNISPYFLLLKANTENFFRHKAQSPAAANMYTTYKDYQKFIKGARYTKGYVPLNARGSNEWRHKTVLAYLVNRFPDIEIKHFFEGNNIKVNQDLFAVSEFLQWIFRSAIRDGKRIRLYIPSERMRTLLYKWSRGKID